MPRNILVCFHVSLVRSFSPFSFSVYSLLLLSFSRICEIILKDLADSHAYDIAAVFGIIYNATLLHLHYFYYKEMDGSYIKKFLPFIVCYCFLLRMWVVSFMLTHAVYCKWRTLKILLVLYETELAILVRKYIIAEAFHIDWYQILSICVSPDWAVVKTIMFTFSYKWLSVYTSVYNIEYTALNHSTDSFKTCSGT